MITRKKVYKKTRNGKQQSALSHLECAIFSDAKEEVSIENGESEAKLSELNEDVAKLQSSPWEIDEPMEEPGITSMQSGNDGDSLVSSTSSSSSLVKVEFPKPIKADDINMHVIEDEEFQYAKKEAKEDVKRQQALLEARRKAELEKKVVQALAVASFEDDKKKNAEGEEGIMKKSEEDAATHEDGEGGGITSSGNDDDNAFLFSPRSAHSGSSGAARSSFEGITSPRNLVNYLKKKKAAALDPDSHVMAGEGIDLRPRLKNTMLDEESRENRKPSRKSEVSQENDGAVLVEFKDIGEGSNSQVPETIGMQRAMEKILLFTLVPAINGVPSLGIPSAESRAKQMLEKDTSDLNRTEICVNAVVAGSESTASKILLDFFLERVPFLGCPSVLVKNTWIEVRSIAIIASLYGRDLQSTRVKHEILSCLIPSGDMNMQNVSETEPDESVLADTARRVAKLTLKGAIIRATGIQVAADCVDLCQQLYGTYDLKSTDEDGFVHIKNSPTAAAKNYFRPQNLNHLPYMYIPMLVVAALGPAILSNPLRYLALVVLCLVAAITWCKSLRLRTQVRLLPRWCWTLVVFGVHASLPLISAHTAVTMMVPLLESTMSVLTSRGRMSPPMKLDRALDGNNEISGRNFIHWFAMALLGVFNLSSILIHHFDQFGVKSRITMLMKEYAMKLLPLMFGWYMFVGYETMMVGSIWSILNFVPNWVCDKNLFAEFWGHHCKLFIGACISVRAQQALIDVLKDARSLLFRLIGAENLVATTLSLLLQGVRVMRNGKDLITFLNAISPPPLACCCVIALRSCAVWYGIAFAILPAVQASVVNTPVFGVIFGSMISTAVWGSFTAVVLIEFVNRQEMIDSPAHRLAYIIPGEVSNRALGYLSAVLSSAQKRAARFVAVGLLERLFSWIWSRGSKLTGKA